MTRQKAGGLLLDDDRLLLVYDTERDVWDVPSRFVDEPETPRQTAVAAFQSALGCAAIVRSPWSRGDVRWEQDGDPIGFRGFLMEIVDGTAEVTGEKYEDLRWVTAEDLARWEPPLAPNLQAVIDQLRLLLIRNSGHRRQVS